jgi:hypothetical protein
LCGEHLQELYTEYFDQIPNLKNCFNTPNNNLGVEGVSDRSNLPASPFTGHLGLESISYWSMMISSIYRLCQYRKDIRPKIEVINPELNTHHSLL